jgi:hypothetical protein
MSVLWSKNDPAKADEDYNVMVATHGTSIETMEDVHGMDAMFKADFGITHDIRWVGIISTFKTPGVPDTGGRRDAFFLVHRDDVQKLSTVKRLHYGFRWWEDVLANGAAREYPLRFRKMYVPVH